MNISIKYIFDHKIWLKDLKINKVWKKMVFIIWNKEEILRTTQVQNTNI